MGRMILSISMFLLATVWSTSMAADAKKDRKADDEKGFVSMFNGKDLTGWKGEPGSWWDDHRPKHQREALSEELLKHVKQGDWNEYRIIAKGSKIKLIINGVLLAEVDDRDKKNAAKSGVIALQMHPGPPMKVQFKDLRIKVFKL